MNLVSAELRRLLHRRVTLLGLVALLLGLGVFAVGAYKDSAPPTAAEQQSMETNFRLAQEDWVRTGKRQIAECEQSNKQYAKEGGTPMDCSDLAPRPEWYGLTPYPVSSITGGIPYLLMIGTTLVMLLVGASAVGAEFAQRTMGSWLVLEPRRSRVMAAKLAALVIFSLATGILVAAALLAITGVLQRVNHIQIDLTETQQWQLLFRLVLGMTLATAAGLASAGMAFLTRSTAAVAALAAAVALGSVTVMGSSSSLQRFGLAPNLEAWIEGRGGYTVEKCGPGWTDCTWVQHFVTRTDAGLLLFGLTAVVLVLGWLFFTRRDVV